MANVTVFETELQNRIAELLQAGHEPYDIARICDCHNSVVYYVLNSARYMQLAYKSAINQLVSEGSPEAVKALIECVKDKKASYSARNTAADKILHYTGMIVNEQGNLEKSPATMSQSELQARLKQLQNEAANRSQPGVIEGDAISADWLD